VRGAAGQLAKVAMALADGAEVNSDPAGLRTLSRVAELIDRPTGVVLSNRVRRERLAVAAALVYTRRERRTSCAQRRVVLTLESPHAFLRLIHWRECLSGESST